MHSLFLKMKILSTKIVVFFASIRTGPAFWGLINPEWSLCNKGRRQSPVNLEPQRLLFDPNLRPLHIDKHRVSVNFITKSTRKRLNHQKKKLSEFSEIFYASFLKQTTAGTF